MSKLSDCLDNLLNNHYNNPKWSQLADAALIVVLKHLIANEPKPLPQYLPSAEWLHWNGGKCPVEPGTRVSFQRRSGEIVDLVTNADDFNWGRYDKPIDTDIIAYRLW